MFSLNSSNIATFISLVIFLVVIISNNRINFKDSTTKQQLLIWCAIILVLSVGYGLYNNISLKHFFTPFAAKVDGETKTIEITKAEDGHFYMNANINGKPILFLVDTGATTTTLTASDANKVNIDLDRLKFNVPVSTANGRSFNASYKLEEISFGPVTFNDVYIMVSKSGLDISLLGMNFLKRFKSYTVENNKLILSYEQ